MTKEFTRQGKQRIAFGNMSHSLTFTEDPRLILQEE